MKEGPSGRFRPRSIRRAVALDLLTVMITAAGAIIGAFAGLWLLGTLHLVGAVAVFVGSIQTTRILLLLLVVHRDPAWMVGTQPPSSQEGDSSAETARFRAAALWPVGRLHTTGEDPERSAALEAWLRHQRAHKDAHHGALSLWAQTLGLCVIVLGLLGVFRALPLEWAYIRYVIMAIVYVLSSTALDSAIRRACDSYLGDHLCVESDLVWRLRDLSFNPPVCSWSFVEIASDPRR